LTFTASPSTGRSALNPISASALRAGDISWKFPNRTQSHCLRIRVLMMSMPDTIAVTMTTARRRSRAAIWDFVSTLNRRIQSVPGIMTVDLMRFVWEEAVCRSLRSRPLWVRRQSARSIRIAIPTNFVSVECVCTAIRYRRRLQAVSATLNVIRTKSVSMDNVSRFRRRPRWVRPQSARSILIAIRTKNVWAPNVWVRCAVPMTPTATTTRNVSPQSVRIGTRPRLWAVRQLRNQQSVKETAARTMTVEDRKCAPTEHADALRARIRVDPARRTVTVEAVKFVPTAPAEGHRLRAEVRAAARRLAARRTVTVEDRKFVRTECVDGRVLVDPVAAAEVVAE